MALAALKKSERQKPSKTTTAKKKWLKAVKLVADRGDPWQRFNLGKIKTERGRRHRRDQGRKYQSVDEFVSLQVQPRHSALGGGRVRPQAGQEALRPRGHEGVLQNVRQHRLLECKS